MENPNVMDTYKLEQIPFGSEVVLSTLLLQENSLYLHE